MNYRSRMRWMGNASRFLVFCGLLLIVFWAVASSWGPATFALGLGVAFVASGSLLMVPGYRMYKKRRLELSQNPPGTQSAEWAGTPRVDANEWPPELLATDPDGTAWYRNRLRGERIAPSVRRLGVNGDGIRLPRFLFGVRNIPWARVLGPTRQTVRPFWLIYIARPDGTFSLFSGIVLSTEVARLVATHPGCPHRAMVNSDALAFGIDPRSLPPN